MRRFSVTILLMAMLAITALATAQDGPRPPITAATAAQVSQLAIWDEMAYPADDTLFNASLTGFLTHDEAGVLSIWTVGADDMPDLLHTAPAIGYALSQDHVVYQTSADDRTLHIWDLARGAERLRLDDAAAMTELAWNADGTRLAYVTQEAAIVVRDVLTQERLMGRHLEGSQLRSLAFLPSTDDLLMQTDYGSGIILYTHSSEDSARNFFLQTRAAAFENVIFSPDRSRVFITESFYVGGETGHISITHAWDPLYFASYVGTFEGRGIGFLPNGLLYSSVAVGTSQRQQTVTLRDPDTLAIQSTFVYGGEVADSAQGWAFAPDGTRLVTVTWNFAAEGGRTDLDKRRYTFWDVAAQQVIATTEAIDSAHVMAFSPDSSLLAVDSREAIGLWDTRTGDLLVTLTGHSAPVTRLTFSADGARLLSFSEDGTIRVWGLPR